MKQLILVGALAGALAAGPAFAQSAAKGDKASESGGRTTPSDQPATAPAPSVPTGDVALGSVQLPKAVMADGKKLRGRHVSGTGHGTGSLARRQGSDGVARAMARVRAGRSGQGPGGRDDRSAVGPQAGREGHTAPGELIEIRNTEGRRLHAAVDQPRRQPLSGSLSDRLIWSGQVGQVNPRRTCPTRPTCRTSPYLPDLPLSHCHHIELLVVQMDVRLDGDVLAD